MVTTLVTFVLSVTTSSNFFVFCRVILCALGALNLLGTCLDLISNYWNQPVVAEDDMNENSEYLLLLDGAQRMDPGQLGIQTDKGLFLRLLLIIP